MNNLAVHHLFHTLRNVIRAQDDHTYVIDRIHGHLWYLSDNHEISETCACELYTATDHFKNEWEKIIFYLDDEKQEEKIEDNNEFFIRQICPKYLDNFHMRTNAFKTAIQTAINLHLTSICL
jgi:hypothetical protein